MLPLILLTDRIVKTSFDGFFDWLLLVAIGIFVASLVLFIQMMQKQKDLERYGYRKGTPTPAIWYIVYFVYLLSFVFSIFSLIMVAIQKKRIEQIQKLFIKAKSNYL